MKRFFLKYAIAIVAGTISIISLFIIHAQPIVWVFILVTLVWIALIVILERLFIDQIIADKEDLLALVITTILSIIGLLTLLESTKLRFFLIIVGSILVGSLFAITLYREKTSQYNIKTLRRMIMMLWVFDVYAAVTTLLALSVFFISIPFWVWGLLLAIVFSYISIMIWKQYFKVHPKHFSLWGIILGLIMLEIVWVIHLLPFGYLVLGFLVTWLWYILQLFIRFHLTPQKIVWRKQRTFLLVNAVLYAILLFFIVRWI